MDPKSLVIKDTNQTFEELFIENNEKILIRILCSEKLVKVDKTFLCSNNPKIFERIIIHIHGGGFVAMSSRSH